MPEHHVEIEIPAKALLHKDVRLVVYSDDVKLGELRMSKGTIDWKPGHHPRAVSMTWERFAHVMESA